MIEVGSGEAIKAQGTKTLNEFLKLLDEILHVFDGIDLIGNAPGAIVFVHGYMRGDSDGF